MRKIGLLTLFVILANRTYASSGSNSFPMFNSNSRGVSQNNRNSGGVLSNNNGNNGRSNRNSGSITVQVFRARPNRVEVMRYLADNIAVVRFQLNTLRRESNNLLNNFSRDLVRSRSIGGLRSMNSGIRSGTVNLFIINEEVVADITIDMINNLMVNIEAEPIGRGHDGGEINPQLRSRVSLFIDRRDSENPIAEFLFRRDIRITSSNRRILEIFSNLMNRIERGDVIEERLIGLRHFGFFEENAFNPFESITPEETNVLRSSSEQRAQICNNLIRRISGHGSTTNVYPDANPVSGDSIYYATNSNTIVITTTSGNIHDPNVRTILNNFLGQNRHTEEDDEDDNDEKNNNRRNNNRFNE